MAFKPNRPPYFPLGRIGRPVGEGPLTLALYALLGASGSGGLLLQVTQRGAALRHAPHAATAPLTYFAYLHTYITYLHTCTLTHTDITRHTHTHAHTHAHPHTHIKTYA